MFIVILYDNNTNIVKCLIQYEHHVYKELVLHKKIKIINEYSKFLVEVHLQATGDAPIMKQKKYKVDGEKRIDWVIAFIRKFLKLEPTDSLVSLQISLL